MNEINLDTATISGTWVNPRNGDSFTVEDNYIENGQFYIKASDGRVLDYNFIQDYVKWDSNTPYVPQKDNIFGEDVSKPSFEESPIINNLINQPTVNIDNEIISRIMGSKPSIDLKFDIDIPDKSKINMLTDMLSVPVDSIINWIVDSIDINNIREQITTSIKNAINPNEGEN